jgi:hypothetical protein
VHGYAHLAIAGKIEMLGGAAGLEAYVQRSLGPILDASLQGLFGPPARPRRLAAYHRHGA